MKFDICMMNPPYAHKEANCLDINFVNKLENIVNRVIAIFPNHIKNKNGPYQKFFNAKHLQNIELLDANKSFDIAVGWKHVGIYDIDNTKTSEKFNIRANGKSFTINNTFDERFDADKKIQWDELYDFCQNSKKLRQELFSKYNSMCNDCDNFIYEENKNNLGGLKKKPQQKLERVKKYLKEGTYKYCIYKGSGNHSYDKPQEWLGQDPDKLFKGQVCWLMNDETVKNNIIYWMESPLFDAWRLFYFNNAKFAACCMYTLIPALPFEKSESEFKDLVDNLYEFSDKEIEILKKYNIHNVDTLTSKS